MIGVSFLSSLAGPAPFSTARTLAGSFRPAFLLLSVLSAIPGLPIMGVPAGLNECGRSFVTYNGLHLPAAWPPVHLGSTS